MSLSDPIFYAIAVPAVVIAGVSKGGFGGGLGIMTVPLLTLVVPPTQAAAIMLPILCAIDLVGLWAYRGQGDRKNLVLLLAAAVIGIVVGAFTFRYLTADTLRIILGAIAIGFTLRWYWQNFAAKRRGGAVAPAARNPVKGGFWGVIAGYTSFVAHAGGPPLSVYLLPLRLDKTVFQATTVVFFAVVNYVKLVPYGLLGMFPVVNLETSLVLMPVAILGTFLGVWLHKRVSDRLFYQFCYAFVLLTGAKLLWDGLAGALG
ncbi:MAG: sulfite exporter TauE/SafE family protein [Phenylobacterium sp.]|nr:sulfite exporter TauE/SafE family protein [Phenylobacterium sp.]